MASEDVLEVDTPSGPAHAQVRTPAGRAVGLLVLGHGAGGGVDAPDLRAVTVAAARTGWVVARVTQPYRVAGRRTPPPPGQLDPAWTAVVRTLRRRRTHLPLVVGGRSSGARVACRTADDLGAAGVVCLAFPLHPPGRPERSRLPELEGCAAEVLAVSGGADPFGVPPSTPGRTVVVLPGRVHSLAGPVEAVVTPVVDALRRWSGEAYDGDGAGTREA